MPLIITIHSTLLQRRPPHSPHHSATKSASFCMGCPAATSETNSPIGKCFRPHLLIQNLAKYKKVFFKLTENHLWASSRAFISFHFPESWREASQNAFGKFFIPKSFSMVPCFPGFLQFLRWDAQAQGSILINRLVFSKFIIISHIIEGSQFALHSYVWYSRHTRGHRSGETTPFRRHPARTKVRLFSALEAKRLARSLLFRF